MLCRRSFGLYETERESAQREGVLKKLAAILQEYAVHEGLTSMDEDEASHKLIQLRTFGSYRLGAHSPDADIDAFVPRISSIVGWRVDVTDEEHRACWLVLS